MPIAVEFIIALFMPSTVIASHTYDNISETLLITFVSGSKYLYYDVPPQVYEQFRKFREKGVFYNREIKNKFRFEKQSN